MGSFQTILDRAAVRKGGEAALLEMAKAGGKTANELAAIPDDRYLAEMTRRIFCAGFVWKIIDDKWPNFEAAFHNFDIDRNARAIDEELEKLTQNEGIVRNGQKIFTVRDNAKFVQAIAAEHGSFGRFLGDWPASDQVGLLALLKKRGKRLGGNSAQYFLRFMGKDSFLLSNDVKKALLDAGVVDSDKFSSKKDLAAVQAAFNNWQAETGLTYVELSRICAFSIESGA